MQSGLPLTQRAPQRRLSTQIALIASTLTVLFLLVVGGVSYYVTRLHITQNIQNTLDNHASLHAGKLSSSLGSVVNTLRSLSQNTLIINSLMDSLTRNTSLDPFLEDFFIINDIPVDIVLTDFEGIAVAGKGDVVDLNSMWVNPVLQTGESYISIEKRSSDVYLFIAVPVFYSGTESPEGALINKVELTQQINNLHSVDGSETVRLLHQGKPVMLGESTANDINYPVDSSLTIIHPIDLPGILANLGLAIEVSTSPEILSQPLNRLALIYIVLGMILLIVVIIISFLAGGLLTRPLRDLEQVAASVVASGSYEHRFNVSSYTEVTRLGYTFNKMLERLGSAHEQVTILANQDVLTGLANRAVFNTSLRSGLLDIKRTNGQLGILLLDLDKFKDINDTMGHPVGDELLKQVSKRLLKLIRATDTVARLGGDEFALIANHLTKASDVAVFAHKIITSLAQPFIIDQHQIHISVSIGIAICSDDVNDPDQLFSNADMALYKAKRKGRANFQFYDPVLNTTAQKRKLMEASIRTALEQSEFCLHYQPKIDIKTSKIVGVEALIRWQSKQGLVYPGEFIPVAEDSGLILPLGEWIMREACLQKKAWDKSGMSQFTVAVNVSAVQLRQDDCIERLLQVIKDTGVDPSGLQIEITESALMEEMDNIACRLGYFQELGISIAIDDIGTGCSSLSNLKLLSVDVLKIDRSFIRDIEFDANDAAITRAVVNLGRSLDMIVVAEGVETIEQFEFLRQEGCHQTQGFLHSPALSAHDLITWGEKHSAFDYPELKVATSSVVVPK